MIEASASIDSRSKAGLSLLAGAWGVGLSGLAFKVSFLVAEALHLPAAREYFGSDVRISDAEITQQAVLGVLGYLAALTFGLWVAGRQSDPVRRWLRLAMAATALPGALLGLAVILLGGLFVKGVA